MENMKQQLMSKNGVASMKLAKDFLSKNEGDKILTFSELSEILGVARGTVQNAVKFLQKNHAIELESRGHLGTFLKNKNMKVLLEIADVKFLGGVMPLPYSKQYEGLATGLIKAMENEYDIPVNLAYMRGAKRRIEMLVFGRYDFAVVSKYAALESIKEHSQIVIAKDFGPKSFLNHHVVVFSDSNKHEIEDGMRIGIDHDSIDQSSLTLKACENKDVKFVKVEYSQILKKIKSNEIDAAVWNEDEIKDYLMDVNYRELNTDSDSDTAAVLVVNKERVELIQLIDELIDIRTVLSIQHLVKSDKMTPSY